MQIPFHGLFLKLFPFFCQILEEKVNWTCQLIKTKNKFPSTNAFFTRTFTFGVVGEIFAWLPFAWGVTTPETTKI